MPVVATEWTAAEELFMGSTFLTTLNGGIDNAVTSLIVADTPPGSPPPAFNFQIDQEILRATAVGGGGNKTWTVGRAQQGTTAAAHSNGARVSTALSTAAGFMGGDGNISIDLGGTRVLWIFSDPLYATAAATVRPGANSTHSIVAIQSGSYDLSAATLTWYPTTDANGDLSSFFPDYVDETGVPNFVWPGMGIVVGGKLLVLGTKRSGPTSAGGNGTWACYIDNPQDSPDDWLLTNIPVFTEAFCPGSPGYGAHSMAAPGDGFLYVWATNLAHQLFASRFPIADAEAGNLSNPEWWCGALGWNFESQDRSIFKQPVSATAGQQSSQHKRADGKWQLTCCEDFTDLQYAVMASGGPGGSFPALSGVYAIPEFGQVLNYAAASHPEQTFAGQAGSDVVMAYTPGFANNSFAPLAYLPKFVKVAGI